MFFLSLAFVLVSGLEDLFASTPSRGESAAGFQEIAEKFWAFFRTTSSADASFASLLGRRFRKSETRLPMNRRLCCQVLDCGDGVREVTALTLPALKFSKLAADTATPTQSGDSEDSVAAVQDAGAPTCFPLGSSSPCAASRPWRLPMYISRIHAVGTGANRNNRGGGERIF